ncbi:DUF1735 domain-containing protein [Pedobacter sp. Leaf176]|uniref:DUF1735 domain-containing protein n=1 Tax=Pedobacter sp. Leaf176 TaxID=1736286 RepID=UPI0006F53E34|nr:DUF1735 domain-containing protein [Pedobacter sp. Leaf176]KQR71811.1 hypothetical protein ASF92_00395 [Pedobacter sp. Leaf176]
MKQRFLKYLSLGIVLTSVLFTSCRKDDFVSGDDPQATLTAGKTFIKVAEGPVNALYFSPFTDVRNVNLFTIRKDASNSDEQATATTVQLTSAPDVITKYNTDNSEDYVLLPESIYTLVSNSSIVKTASGYTFNFAPGEFAKELKILLDGSKYDLSKKYAVAYNVTSTGNASLTATTQKSIIVLISIKNKYDGIYAVTGTMVDVTNATLSHVNNALGTDAPMQYELRTISATKCAVYDNYVYGGFYAVISSAGSFSQYGSFSAVFEFDPATDKIIAVTNYYGQPASNTRAGRLDPTGVNTYNNGTITVKYNMLQPSVVTAAPNVRTTWDETWKYLGSR